MSLRPLIRSLVRSLLRTNDVDNYLRRRRLAVKRRIYRKPFSLDETRRLLESLGMTRGRVVWVQSSWDEFYNLAAKPSEVLKLMLELIGPEGTLVMPAFPMDPDAGKVLEIDVVPSSSGLLTEVFRRHRGVHRSIHLSASVCALGPAAEYLVRDHHLDDFAWGARSPYQRLIELDARLICLGLGRFVRNLTPLHAVECILYDEIPYFRQILRDKIKYRWKRKTGEQGEHEFYLRSGRLSLGGYGRHFPSKSYVERRLSSLEAYAIDARVAIDHAVALARTGITIYAEPRPLPRLFVPAAKEGSSMHT